MTIANQMIRHELDIIAAARCAMSEANWTVGQCAALLMSRQFCRGRSETDFCGMMGLTPDQFHERRRVWEMFSDVRESFPRLLWDHFYAAREWDDATDCLKWANDVQANIPEMRAWRRAQHGDDLI